MEELEIVEQNRIPGVSVFLNCVDYRTAHFHSEWEILWILDAPLQMIASRQSLIASPGEIVIFSPGMPHEFRKVEEGCTFLCVQISPKILPNLSHRVLDGCLADDFMDTGVIRQQLYAMADAYFREEAFYELRVMAQITDILYRILSVMPSHSITNDEIRTRDMRNARMIRLQKYVEENYMHKIRLADFAEREDCTLSFMSHYVRKYMNQTFQEYVNTVRFNAACRLIDDGNKKMLDVCMESGFSDYRYFARAFRENCGMTPEQYAGCQSGAKQSGRKIKSLQSQEQIFTPEESLPTLERMVKLNNIDRAYL